MMVKPASLTDSLSLMYIIVRDFVRYFHTVNVCQVVQHIIHICSECISVLFCLINESHVLQFTMTIFSPNTELILNKTIMYIMFA